MTNIAHDQKNSPEFDQVYQNIIDGAFNRIKSWERGSIASDIAQSSCVILQTVKDRDANSRCRKIDPVTFQIEISYGTVIKCMLISQAVLMASANTYTPKLGKGILSKSSFDIDMVSSMLHMAILDIASPDIYNILKSLSGDLGPDQAAFINGFDSISRKGRLIVMQSAMNLVMFICAHEYSHVHGNHFAARSYLFDGNISKDGLFHDLRAMEFIADWSSIIVCVPAIFDLSKKFSFFYSSSNDNIRRSAFAFGACLGVLLMMEGLKFHFIDSLVSIETHPRAIQRISSILANFSRGARNSVHAVWTQSLFLGLKDGLLYGYDTAEVLYDGIERPEDMIFGLSKSNIESIIMDGERASTYAAQHLYEDTIDFDWNPIGLRGVNLASPRHFLFERGLTKYGL